MNIEIVQIYRVVRRTVVTVAVETIDQAYELDGEGQLPTPGFGDPVWADNWELIDGGLVESDPER